MRILNSSTIFITIGLAIGLGSAMQSLEGIGQQPVAGNAGWKEWRLSANDRMQPYALGHFLAAGSVPTPVSTHFYVRDFDDDGNILRGDCSFTISGPAISARWWTLSVRNSEGAKSKAILSAGRAVLDSNRNLNATIAVNPTSGNWLQPSDTGPFTLTYVVSEPVKSEALTLPRVTRVRC